MKKIIAGAQYNTETARFIGTWDNGAEYGQMNRSDEYLYQTKSGKYFLRGEGGPMTTYAEHHGNSTSGGEQILPLTASEAREWAEEKLTADEYQKEFGEVEEASDNKRPLNLTVAPEVYRLLEAKKVETGMSISKLIELAVVEIYKV